MKQYEFTRNITAAIDPQQDFINGSLAIDGAEEIIDPLNRVIEATRLSNGDIAASGDQHPELTPHFDIWPVHCVKGTQGAQFHPDLDIRSTDIILSKGMGQTDGYSAWEGVSESGETLETLITPRANEKVRVFVGGLATDYCVKATALDIAKHFGNDDRVELYLLRDAIRAVEATIGDEVRALEAMEAAKFIAISSADAVAMIEKELR